MASGGTGRSSPCLMVLGTDCKCALQAACATSIFCAHDAAHQPVALSVCAHQLGKGPSVSDMMLLAKLLLQTRTHVFQCFP